MRPSLETSVSSNKMSYIWSDAGVTSAGYPALTSGSETPLLENPGSTN